ncbi:hypothetical protein MTO96_028673 [Rhipicephalus appendiculatus]
MRDLASDDSAANYYANGRQVRGYHVVNVALHCACSVLVAVIARRVIRITALHACLAAMLFAVHPVHTEATILLLCFRLWILQGSFPEFSEMDNPASFSSSGTTRLLTYSYLCAFNAWLVLCPSTLSYDWQMGSIPLVTSPFDPRNMATLAVFASLLAFGWRALTTSNMKDRHRRYSTGGRRAVPPSHALLSSAPVVHYKPLLHSGAAFCCTHLEPEQRLGIQGGPVRVS